MKRQLFAITVFAAFACSNLLAQAPPLEAKIPFDFAIGKAVMPAGSYHITCSNHVLMFREVSGKPAAATLTTPTLVTPPSGLRSGNGVLVFQRYGGEYFLSGLWAPDARDGLAVPAGVRQKELAARQSRPEATTIALNK